MYLVHVRLHAPDHTRFPPDAAQMFLGCAHDGEGAEHVSTHTDGPEGPVVGFYLTARSLAAAEHTAVVVCRRALHLHPALAGLSVRDSGAVLVPEYWDGLLRSVGRDMQLQDPSTGNPFHPF
ncbi:hypothetical protein [Streptomyces xanthophaeus]